MKNSCKIKSTHRILSTKVASMKFERDAKRKKISSILFECESRWRQISFKGSSLSRYENVSRVMEFSSAYKICSSFLFRRQVVLKNIRQHVRCLYDQICGSLRNFYTLKAFCKVFSIQKRRSFNINVTLMGVFFRHLGVNIVCRFSTLHKHASLFAADTCNMSSFLDTDFFSVRPYPKLAPHSVLGLFSQQFLICTKLPPLIRMKLFERKKA